MDENSNFDQLLANNGFSMMIANKENKELENLILQLQEHSTSLKNDVNRNENRVEAMSEHLKNVKNEIDYSHSALQGRKKEFENEINMGKINDMQISRLKNESKKINVELDNLHEYKNVHQNRIFLLGKKIDEIKSKINWDQSKLEIWLEESAKQDEDIALMKKYIKEDEGKLKEITLHINKLTGEKKNLLNELDKVTTDKITAQYELEKLAEIYKSSKIDRDKIIKQWDDILKQINLRDKDIEKLALELSTLKNEFSEKQSELKTQLNFFENQKNNNSETEKKIEIMERNADSLRHDLQKLSSTRVEFKEELEILKRTVNNCAQELEKKRLEGHEVKNNISKKKEQYEKVLFTNEELSKNLEMLELKFKSAEEYANEMDKILNNEEVRHTQLENQLKIFRNNLFEANEEFNEKKKDLLHLKAKIEGTLVTQRHLESRVAKYDAEILRQEELLYNQDFEIQHLNRRIDTMQGSRENGEKEELEKKLLELKETFEQRVESHSVLANELSVIEDELRKAKKMQNTLIVEKEDYKNKISELNLHIDNAQKELKSTIKRKESFLVDSNILKLDLESFKTKLAENDSNIKLNKEKDLKLEKAMKERQEEIKHHREILAAQIKNAESEKSNLNLKFHSKIMEIEKLKRKNELLTVSMQPPEGEVIHSQAYFIIKAAQEKEELKIKGEALNSEILKTEEELHALENTVQLINDRNAVYKNGFCKTANESQKKELETLENEVQELRKTIRDKNKSIKNKMTDLKTVEQEAEDFSNEMIISKNNLEITSKNLAQAKVEFANLEDKIKRATRNNQKLEKEIVSSNSKSADPANDKKEIVLKDLKFLNDTITKILVEASYDNEEISAKMDEYFKANKIPLELEDADTSVSLHTLKSSSRQASSKRSSACNKNNFNFSESSK